jgi:hypothetical protein
VTAVRWIHLSTKKNNVRLAWKDPEMQTLADVDTCNSFSMSFSSHFPEATWNRCRVSSPLNHQWLSYHLRRKVSWIRPHLDLTGRVPRLCRVVYQIQTDEDRRRPCSDPHPPIRRVISDTNHAMKRPRFRRWIAFVSSG